MKEKSRFLGVIHIILVLILSAMVPVTSNAQLQEGWSEDARLTELEGNSSLHPRVAIDSQNNMHVLFGDFRNGPPEIYYMKIDHQGNIVVPEKVITDLDAASSNLGDIVCDSNDNIHVIWSDVRDTGPISNLEIYYEKLDSMGNTLVDEKRITFMPYYSVYPSIAVDSLDNLHIAWCEEMEFGNIFQEEVFYAKLDNDGNIIVDPLEITPNDGDESLFPDIALDSTGNVHIMWIDDRNETGTTKNQDYWYTKLDNNGNTLVDDTMIFFKGEHYRPCISIDTEDMLHVICGSFQGWKGNTYRQIYRVLLDNDGNIVDPEVRLTNDDGNASHPKAVFDSQGNLHIVWEDERHQNTEIYYMKLNLDGNILVDETRLTANASKSQEPVIALDETQTLRVLWSDGRDYEDGDRVEVYSKYSIVEVPNAPPEVGITSPTIGKVVSGIVDISGWASDTDGSIMQVEVRIDSGAWKMAAGTTSWNIQWNTTGLADGEHLIYARAYDGTDFSGVAARNVFVNNTVEPQKPNEPPTVTIQSPIDVEVSDTIGILGSAFDSDGSIHRVQVRIDSKGWKTASGTVSWSLEWDTTTVNDGEHVISARAEDDLGEYSKTETVTISVNNAPNNKPQIQITFPLGGEVSNTILITGTAGDEDGDETVTRVEVNIQGEWTEAQGTREWSLEWNTNTLDDGELTIMARAFDGLEYSDTASVLVMVNNPHSPLLTIISVPPAKVSGTYTIMGTATDSDGEIVSVEIQIDDGQWILFSDLPDWSYELDSTELGNGPHLIRIRVTDDEGEVDVKTITLEVSNPEEVPWLIILLLIIIVVTAVIWVTAKKAGKRSRV